MKRLECLDGLRGVLAMYVVLGHMAPFAVVPDWVQSSVSHGGAAVDMFFILSGLVISQSLERLDGNRLRFLLARVLRIYPVFLPLFALAVALQPLSCGFDQMPWILPESAARDICADGWRPQCELQIPAHLLMIHGLFPNAVLPYVWVSYLGAAWSLSTEWQFYVLAMLVWRPGERLLTTLLLALALAGLVWQAVAPEPWQFSRAFLPNKAHFFALGIASLALVRRQPTGRLHYGVALCLTLAICGLSGGWAKMLPPLAWCACLAVQLRPDLPVLASAHRLMRCRPALWLGAISYPVYLANEPIQKALAPMLGSLVGGKALWFTVLWVPAAIGLPVLAAIWLHTHVEVPAMRWRWAAGTRWRHRAPVTAGHDAADPSVPARFATKVPPVPVQGLKPGL